MFWTYENWVHNRARVHIPECAHCNDGRGSHNAEDSQAGRWLGPFEKYSQAINASKFEVKPCGHCSPDGKELVKTPEEPLVGSYIEKNIDAAISFAIENYSKMSITYSQLFEAAGLEQPQWYFEQGFRSVITDFMESFHFKCARTGLPPFDAIIVNASGERANLPGIGYFSVNGLSDPLDDRTSYSKAKAAILFREEQLQKIRAWGDGRR